MIILFIPCGFFSIKRIQMVLLNSIYKACLVGDGKSHKVGVDCDETFSPMGKPATIQYVLSIALSKSRPIH